MRAPCCDQRIGGGIAARHQRREFRPKRDPRRAGKRGEIDDQVGVLLAHPGERIAEHQSSLGIGVADLDGQPLA